MVLIIVSISFQQKFLIMFNFALLITIVMQVTQILSCQSRVFQLALRISR